MVAAYAVSGAGSSTIGSVGNAWTTLTPGSRAMGLIHAALGVGATTGQWSSRFPTEGRGLSDGMTGAPVAAYLAACLAAYRGGLTVGRPGLGALGHLLQTGRLGALGHLLQTGRLMVAATGLTLSTGGFEPRLRHHPVAHRGAGRPPRGGGRATGLVRGRGRAVVGLGCRAQRDPVVDPLTSSIATRRPGHSEKIGTSGMMVRSAMTPCHTPSP